eukprot:jgi/Tetstr1/427200/TSEL_017388.t1
MTLRRATLRGLTWLASSHGVAPAARCGAAAMGAGPGRQPGFLGFRAFAGIAGQPFGAAPLLRGPPRATASTRGLATSVADLQDKVDQLNDLFVEARDEIEFATEDAETVYFNESAEAARKAVWEVMTLWEEVLGQLDEAERGKLQRGMGMKMEQLKAELSQLDTLHD